MGVKGSHNSRVGPPFKSQRPPPRINVNPPRGRNFSVKRGCKGLEEVGKGWEGHVMLRGSLSNHYFTFSHP